MKLILFAILVLSFIPLLAQSPPHVSQTPVSGKISGTVRVPGHGKAWHHVKVRLPKKSDPRLAVVWIEDVDHPISSPSYPGDPNWQKYDPRNVTVRGNALTFDAIAGDRIRYTVGWRQP